MGKKQTPLTKLRYENKELENRTTARNEEVVVIARDLAHDHSISNTPPLEEKRGIVWYRKLKNFCQQTLSDIKAALQVDITKNTKEYRVLDEKEKQIRTEISQADHQSTLKKREVEKARNAGKDKARAKKRRFFWVRILCVLFMSADFFFSAASLQKIGIGKFGAYMIGASIAIGILSVAEGVPYILARIEGRVKRIVTVCLIFLGMSLIFYAIAYLRTTSTDGTVSSGTPRMIFVGLNLFLLLVTVFIQWRHRPTKQEIADLDEFLALEKELKALESKKNSLNQDVLSVISERQELEDMERILRIYGSDLEEQVQDAYHTAYTEYCNSNLMHRSDNTQGQIPPFMESDPEPLMFHFKNQ